MRTNFKTRLTGLWNNAVRAKNVEGCIPSATVKELVLDSEHDVQSSKEARFSIPSFCTTDLVIAFAMTSVSSNHSIAKLCCSRAVWLLVRQESERVAGDDLTFLTLPFVISITTWSFIFLASSRRGKQIRRIVGISFVLLLTQSPAFRVPFLQNGDFPRVRVQLPCIYRSEKERKGKGLYLSVKST